MSMQLPTLAPRFLGPGERSGHQNWTEIFAAVLARWKFMTRKEYDNGKVCKTHDLGRNFHAPFGPHTFCIMCWPRRVLRTIGNHCSFLWEYLFGEFGKSWGLHATGNCASMALQWKRNPNHNSDIRFGFSARNNADFNPHIWILRKSGESGELAAESASHPSVLMWAGGMCTAF